MKTEQCRKVMKSKATERSFRKLKEKLILIVEHFWKEEGNNYNFEDPVDCLHNSRTMRTKKILRGQARKSARGMPWHQEPMKDVTSCDKLRGGANIH